MFQGSCVAVSLASKTIFLLTIFLLLILLFYLKTGKRDSVWCGAGGVVPVRPAPLPPDGLCSIPQRESADRPRTSRQ